MLEENNNFCQNPLQPPKTEEYLKIEEFAVQLRKDNAKMTAIQNAEQIFKNNSKKQPQIIVDDTSADRFSKLGKFGWHETEGTVIPYLTRYPDIRLVSKRMAEVKLLGCLERSFSFELLSCMHVQIVPATIAEVNLLNDINQNHSDFCYGRENFKVADPLIAVSDLTEAVAFLRYCCLAFDKQSEIRKRPCGFTKIGRETVAYVLVDNKIYSPMFYFDGDIKPLEEKAVEINGWHLAYIKLLCKVQGIRAEFFEVPNLKCVEIDFLKTFFVPGTLFEETWPSENKLVYLTPGSAQMTASNAAQNTNPLQKLASTNQSHTPQVSPSDMPVTTSYEPTQKQRTSPHSISNQSQTRPKATTAHRVSKPITNTSPVSTMSRSNSVNPATTSTKNVTTMCEVIKPSPNSLPNLPQGVPATTKAPAVSQSMTNASKVSKMGQSIPVKISYTSTQGCEEGETSLNLQNTAVSQSLTNTSQVSKMGSSIPVKTSLVSTVKLSSCEDQKTSLNLQNRPLPTTTNPPLVSQPMTNTSQVSRMGQSIPIRTSLMSSQKVPTSKNQRKPQNHQSQYNNRASPKGILKRRNSGPAPTNTPRGLPSRVKTPQVSRMSQSSPVGTSHTVTQMGQNRRTAQTQPVTSYPFRFSPPKQTTSEPSCRNRWATGQKRSTKRGLNSRSVMNITFPPLPEVPPNMSGIFPNNLYVPPPPPNYNVPPHILLFKQPPFTDKYNLQNAILTNDKMLVECINNRLIEADGVTVSVDQVAKLYFQRNGETVFKVLLLDLKLTIYQPTDVQSRIMEYRRFLVAYGMVLVTDLRMSMKALDILL